MKVNCLIFFLVLVEGLKVFNFLKFVFKGKGNIERYEIFDVFDLLIF